jgi:DtxR family Mn-dependent transcriptional regulator
LNITQKESEYLKVLYRKQVESNERVSTMILARSFKVSPATVTESFQKLADKNLISYIPYQSVKLTNIGIIEAGKYMRNHRILETLFVRLLKYDSTSACKEAADIDYYCSQKLIDRICTTYNHPLQCPCNKKIVRNTLCENNIGVSEGEYSKDLEGERS